MLVFTLANLLASAILSPTVNSQQQSSPTTANVPTPAPTTFTERTAPPTERTVPPSAMSLTSPKPPFAGDFVVQYYDKNISTQELLVKLNITSAPFDVRNICPTLRYSCESVCPLGGNEARERSTEKPCYCDNLCVELGDCCFDYFSRCTADPVPKRGHIRHICAKKTNDDYYGYAMTGSCPSNKPDNNLESLCTAMSSSFDLPVSDLDSNTVYKNVFCARCSGVTNLVYWKFSASCKGNYSSSDIPKNRSRLLKFIMRKCKWSFKEPRDNYNDLKQCLTVEQQCPNSELIEIEPLLPNLCSFYAFPVCYSVGRKNPHCMICRGLDVGTYPCDCIQPPPTDEPVGGIPSLDILFDFSSPSSHSVKVGDETTVVENKACDDGFFFDPFTERCIKVHNITPPNSANETTISYSCNGSGFVKMDTSSAVFFPNGSIWVPLHKRLYNNGSYYINGSSLFVCMNLTRNFTETTTLTSGESKITPKQIITYIGCAISVISLILLLGIYIAFAELRTLPGKNLMSLSCAMLLYHTVYFLTGQTNQPNLCTAVSVFLHYFLLSSFCWMSVMAFDIAKTFGRKGQTARSSRSGNTKAALLKYSIFVWTTPAIVVITSFILDKTDTVFIGYGDKVCWISNGKALIVVLGIPVALILVFNFVALTITLVSIRKVQKTTRRVADQSQQTSLPVLYVKLSSALGFTWVLGFIFPFTQVEFLAYLFVICNSLQGFFIFLAFVANKRTMNKIRGLWKSFPKSNRTTGTNSNTGPSITQTTRAEDALTLTTLTTLC